MEDDRIEIIISGDVKVQVIKSTITSLLKKKKLKNNFFCAEFFKIKVFTIYLILILASSFASLNLLDNKNSFIDKKVNLGLDLQGDLIFYLKPIQLHLSKSVFKTK